MNTVMVVPTVHFMYLFDGGKKSAIGSVWGTFGGAHAVGAAVL